MITPSHPLLAAMREISPSITARAGEIEQARRLPADLAAIMAARGVFRMLIPRGLGGLECDPATFCAILEQLGRADASVGWCAMIGATSALPAAFLAPEAAREIFADPATITGGVFAPMGRAVQDGDRYRVSGRWAWGSGSANCRWLSGGCLVLVDGKPRLLANGAPDVRTMFFPAAAARLHDTWQVAGLAGTGSGDFEVADLLVPANRTLSLITDRPRVPGALYAFPMFGLLALGIAAVMLGNGQGALDDLARLAAGTTTAGSRRPLAERSGAQATLAEATARLHAARAYVFAAIDQAWTATREGAPLGTATRASLRLAATFATRTAADVTRAMYDLGGGSALFLASPLQRRFRDAHAGTQHMMVAGPTYELTGRVLMGLDTDATTL